MILDAEVPELEAAMADAFAGGARRKLTAVGEGAEWAICMDGEIVWLAPPPPSSESEEVTAS